MKVVLDTNVLVSAAFRDRGPERVVLFVAENPGIEWIVSEAILSEYLEVLSRPKFGLASAVLLRWERMLASVTTCIDVSASVLLRRDPADAKFLACALTAGAEFLVTGDRDFEEARRLSTTTIVSVSVFERTVCRNWSPR
jgi:putative PIN family toxin of toxin-antitoxin system